jgi:hypothetical protein
MNDELYSDCGMFYDVKEDLEKYPDNVIYNICGGRSTGKTYSTLKFCKEGNHKFVFLKRTNEDVKIMAPFSVKEKMDAAHVDLSPFKSLNRDMGWNVRAFSIGKGFGGFWNCDENNQPIGDPIGYIVSLYMISKLSGADFSECEYEIFDECVPRAYERTSKTEGEQVLEFYRTIERAGRILGKNQLKIILLSNSLNVACPVYRTMELTNDLVDMQQKHEHARELKDRKIFIRRIPNLNGFREKEAQDPIYKAMSGTKWASMSLENNFAYNDFSYIGKMPMKGMRCIAKVYWERKHFYIYKGEQGTYISTKQANKYDFEYNLERDGDQKKFYIEQVSDIKEDIQDDMARFDNYELYDLISNYTALYKV